MYAQRNEGYDWVAVRVRADEDETLSISVRSRADRKKPTCTLDRTLYPKKENVYYTTEEGQEIYFAFSGDSLTITSNDPQNTVLYYFCSGGGSLAGTYTRVEGSLDEEQIDPRTFVQVLRLQGAGFGIDAQPKGEKTELTISSMGLENSDGDPIILSIDGEVVDAEIEDLNSDGSPEVVVYTRSGEKSFGNVYGVSGNSNISMSSFYFPPTTDNPEINEGYDGRDEFALVETSLVQRFPIYLDGEPTGKTRQVTYELVNGEAGRRFQVKKVEEF
jgi:hypothetical protein